MTAPLILVLAGEPKSTLNALHEACAKARAQGNAVSIAQMVPVSNPMLLGDPHAYWSLTSEQQRRLDDYVQTAEDYGIRVFVHAMQMIDYRSALLDLIEMLQPQSAYVPAPARGPRWWREWREARLSAAFEELGCALVWVRPDFQPRIQYSPLDSERINATQGLRQGATD